MKHSKVVGGSTAKRVVNCPGSVALCDKMPPKPSSKYANEGTLLHSAMDALLSMDDAEVIGMTYEGEVLTDALYAEKVVPALAALDEIDPDQQMEFITESQVSFGKLLPDAFGTTDLLGRLGNKAVVLDWKFGDGVPVEAEENMQLMYYAAAAMRTKETKWVFDGVDEIEFVIVQPPHVKRWTTNKKRIKQFQTQLIEAVKMSEAPDAPLKAGDWCRWCAAKPLCPVMTGAVDRAAQVKIKELDINHINAYLKNADILEGWISDLRALAHRMAEEGGVKFDDWKLVAKRATRKWINEADAEAALREAGIDPFAPASVLSPAQAEKALKKVKAELPVDLVVSVSSGSTLAPRDDPRPEVLQIGQQLNAALSKLV